MPQRRRTMMSSFDLHRFAPLLGGIAFLVLGLLLPTIRLRLRIGKWGFAYGRPTDSTQKVIVTALMSLLSAGLLWTLLYAMLDPTTLDIWNVPPNVRSIGWIFAAIGSGLVVVAQAQMGSSWRIGITTERTALVTSGVYGFVRSPIYAGFIIM